MYIEAVYDWLSFWHCKCRVSEPRIKSGVNQPFKIKYYLTQGFNHFIYIYWFTLSKIFLKSEMTRLRYRLLLFFIVVWHHAMGEYIPLLGQRQESGPCHVADEGFPLQCILFVNRVSSSKPRCPLVRPFLSLLQRRGCGETMKNLWVYFCRTTFTLHVLGEAAHHLQVLLSKAIMPWSAGS